MARLLTALLPALAVLFCLGGLGAYAVLFIPRMNVYWFILSPLILAVYQIPAVVLVWIWRRRKARQGGQAEAAAESAPEADQGPPRA
jgi:hypothetical protein